MLTHQQRTAIKIGHAQRRPLADIAAELGVSLSDVQQCLARMRPREASVTQRADPATPSRETRTSTAGMKRRTALALARRV